jgi:uncharacterized protein (TIGR00730 family)
MATLSQVCVFLGSSLGSRPLYAETAGELGRLLARRGQTLIYGGARVGLMGVLADAALEAGGRVIGVIPRSMLEREIAHRDVSELLVVESMHERKARMADLAAAFICFPGGYGTLDEFCEVLTWGQLSLHRKPCGLLNLAGYYDPLIAQFDRSVEEGLLQPRHRALVQTHERAEELLNLLDRAWLESAALPAASKWDSAESLSHDPLRSL